MAPPFLRKFATLLGTPRPGALDRWDLLLMAGIVLANPLTWLGGQSAGMLVPDVLGYFAFAWGLETEPKLFLEGWGTQPTGLILPPLYPALIYGLDTFVDDTLRSAELISRWCLIVAALPLYLVASRESNRLLALVGLVAVSLTFSYFSIGAAPLTESLFVLCYASCLFLLHRWSQDRSKILFALLLGGAAGLTFLARQIGLVFVVLSIGLVAGQWFTAVEQRKWVLRSLAAVVLGAAVFLVPYTVGLHHQTGQSPLTQKFRIGDAPSPIVPKEIEPYVRELRARQGKTYERILLERREQLRLLPDGSDLLLEARFSDEGEKPSIGARVLGRIADPALVSMQLGGNLGNLQASLGWPATILLILSTLALLFGFRNRRVFQERWWLVPVFTWAYVLTVSVVTSMVPRYTDAALPLLAVYFSVGIFQAWKLAGRYPRGRWVVPIVVGALGLAGTATTPRSWRDLPTAPHGGLERRTLARLSTHLEPGAPVFVTHPLYATLLRGTFRMCPNDSLERTVDFARATGVEWIVIARTPGDAWRTAAYRFARWIQFPPLALNRPDLVRLAGTAEEEQFLLLRVVPDDEKGDSGAGR